MPPRVLSLILSNRVNEAVFRHIAKEKTIQLRNLLNDLDGRFVSGGGPEIPSASGDHEFGQHDIEAALQSLEGADLIGKKRASVPLLNTYYVTAAGMKAEQEIAGQ
jgi:hypothetical protein